MKFIFIADLHLAQYGPVVENDFPEKLYYILQSMQEVVDFAKAKKIQTIVVGGDIFHTKSIIHSLAQSVLLDFVRNNRSIDFVVLDGNHDMSSKSAKASVSSLKCLDSEPNVHTIHEPEQNADIYFLPWIHVSKELLSNVQSKFLVSHFGVNEAKLSSGISIVSDVGLRDLANFRYVLLGHYHKPQEIMSSSLSLYYVGSLIQLDWSEKHEEKRFLVVDTELESIESFPTTRYRKYVELLVTKETKREVIERAKALLEEGHHVRIMTDDSTLMPEVSEEVGQEASVILRDESDSKITNRGISSSMSMEDKLNRYLDLKNITQDREFYVRKAIEIIEKSGGEK